MSELLIKSQGNRHSPGSYVIDELEMWAHMAHSLWAIWCNGFKNVDQFTYWLIV
jgi:hypothetical protein